MIRNIKKSVRLFKKQYMVAVISEKSICDALSKQGYTVIYFNAIFNDDNVSQIITNLKLDKYIQSNKGFTYANDKYRLVFVNEDLSEEERLLVLAHEQGHIFCGHTFCQAIIGQDVKQEHEANEFAHYLLYPSKGSKVKQLMKERQKLLLAILICTAVIGAGIMAFSITSKENLYYGEFYVTSTGNKYHKKDCIFVKNKMGIKRMTKEEFESGNYEPCKTCLP